MMVYKVLVCFIIFIAITNCQRVKKCPDTDICFCQEYSLECNCTTSSSLILRSFSKYDWKKVTIENCNRVEILFGAFLHMDIEEMEFKNIAKLVVNPFAFSGVKSIRKFNMKDISNLDINLFGLSGLYKIETLNFKNVTALNLSEFAISVGNITLLEIEDSNFILQSFSFVMSDMNDIFITNSTFKSISNASLIIREADRVDIRNSTFALQDEKSLVILWTGLVEIFNCTFKILPTGFLFGHADHFFFNGNFIENSEINAFISFDVNHTAEFKNNRFQTAEPDSLFPNPGNNVSETIDSLIIRGNEFYCDCRLAWLFNNREIYSPIIKYSKCYNHKDVAVSQLFTLLYRNETCRFNGYESVQLQDKGESQFLSDKQRLLSNAPYLVTETLSVKCMFIVIIIAIKEFSWNIS
ncbi:uncharacterized protein NPIL_159521 [Nephila pilipes]|uniref:Uncharacterized protein n=1 Tax=Nephila pilipes TaxID=299642 RepID=A0A8X6T9F7_NEPPI|nr:uncharacterized protein NPIL_159521 [Nephila pilipes]